MDKETYCIIENYMLSMMGDSAHDALHIYRVLHQALTIAKAYPGVNREVLTAACLLHDIGREAQFRNPQLCHAEEGGKMAYTFMKKLGWEENLCRHIQDCITTHRFRSTNPPQNMTIEAKILFDADKLDVTGALGIARTLMYKGQAGEPLYTVDENWQVQDGCSADEPESFFKEYQFKLIKLYDQFYTKEAAATARKRKEFTACFFNELMGEVMIEDLGELLDL